MIHIESSPVLPFDRSLLECAAQAALDHESARGDLTLVLTDDEQLRALNRASHTSCAAKHRIWRIPLKNSLAITA